MSISEQRKHSTFKKKHVFLIILKLFFSLKMSVVHAEVFMTQIKMFASGYPDSERDVCVMQERLQKIHLHITVFAFVSVVKNINIVVFV